MICPTNQAVETDPDQSTAIVLWTAPAANDNSRMILNATCNAENGTKFEIGEKEVMCQAVDQAGNQATCVFVIYVTGK